MRRQSVPQIRAICGNTPKETALLFNEAMQELAPFNPRYERDGGVFWITYTVITDEAETLAEKYELAGDRSKCVDCPKCTRDLNRFGEVDARKKWATCGSTGERIRIDEAACDTYYEMKERRTH